MIFFIYYHTIRSIRYLPVLARLCFVLVAGPGLLLVGGQSVQAQSDTDPGQHAPERRWAVSLQLSSTGPGLHGVYLLSPKRRLYGRLGLSYFAYNSMLRLKVSNDGDGSYVQITPDLVIGIGQAALRWYPFRRGAFYATGGVGYTWRPDLTFVLVAENTLDFGGLTVKPENVGTIKAGLRWKNVLGYAGFGFGRAVPRRRIGFGAELGLYYLGKPAVVLDYDGFLETTTIDEQIPNVERNLSGYRYLPVLSFFVSCAIH
jgi:hypothetical protein